MYLWSEVKVIERNKVAFEQPNKQCEVHSIRKLALQVIHIQVDLPKVLVGKCDERLLDHLQLVRSMVKQCVKGIPFLAPEAEVIIACCQLLGDDPVLEDAIALCHNHYIHSHILREAHRSTKVAGKGHLV